MDLQKQYYKIKTFQYLYSLQGAGPGFCSKSYRIYPSVYWKIRQQPMVSLQNPQSQLWTPTQEDIHMDN